jgi:hypothetical protein
MFKKKTRDGKGEISSSRKCAKPYETSKGQVLREKNALAYCVCVQVSIDGEGGEGGEEGKKLAIIGKMNDRNKAPLYLLLLRVAIK